MNHPQHKEYGRELLAFLNGCSSPYHAAADAATMLTDSGFVELNEGEAWELKRGGKYFLRRNHSALIAFEMGDDPAIGGFRVIGAHTDSPGFKIKPGGCMITGDGYVKLNTEPYGGSILSSWFDRPLSIAGRVTLKSDNALRPQERLVDLLRPVAIIPNLCIHFNRDVNSGYAYNKQVDLLPLIGSMRNDLGNVDPVMGMVASALDVSPSSIADFDLHLYEADPGTAVGADGEYLSASRIDNLSMFYAGVIGLTQSGGNACTKVLAAFDNEEVGSVSVPGADSSFLVHVLRRICLCAGSGGEGYYRAVANSLAVSADCAHAVHPNYPEKHDPINRPVLGEGPAIKYSASQRYSTTAWTAAAFEQICRSASVPCQKFVNRSDIPGGSTIGPALSSRTSIPTVDVGAPILAMHSVRELGSVIDNVYSAMAFAEFYGYAEKTS